MLFRCLYDSRSIQVYEFVNVCNGVIMLRDPEYALMQQTTCGHHKHNILTMCLDNFMEFRFWML